MNVKRTGVVVSLAFVVLAGEILYVLFYFIEKYEGGDITMDKIISDYGVLLTAVVTFAGIIGIVVSQILFFKKDSDGMRELKDDVSAGNIRLNFRIDRKQELLSGEHGRLSQEHRDIRDTVREIRIRQEQELRMQEKIKDTVPDAEMIKNGIEKMCQENLRLRDEVHELMQEIQQLKERNKELSQEIQRDMMQNRGRER